MLEAQAVQRYLAAVCLLGLHVLLVGHVVLLGCRLLTACCNPLQTGQSYIDLVSKVIQIEVLPKIASDGDAVTKGVEHTFPSFAICDG